MTTTLKMQFIGQLYPFQQKVVDWSRTTEKGIIGLDMGLGKTVITIAMICKQNYKRTIVVLPLQILEQWKTSFLCFTNLTARDICVFQGPSRKSIDPSKYRVVLTTYDVVRTDMSKCESFLRGSTGIFDCIVLDEAHKIRNKKTQTYATCYNMSKDIPTRWLLTGTAIHNKFADFTNLCEFLDIRDLYKTFSDSAATLSWKNKYYYRLTKAQCDLQLPEKSVHEHFLNLSPKHSDKYLELYQETADFYDEYTSNPTKSNLGMLIVKILRLRQCCNHIDAILSEEQFKVLKNRHDELSSSKFDKISQIIKDADAKDKLIIFSQWSHSLQILGSHLKAQGITYFDYNGGMSIGNRNQVLDNFKKSDKRVLLITLTSGGVGLDMSFANHVIIMDSWWNQALEEQAIDRVYRIGQMKKVEVHRLYVNNTIESWMVEMKKEKLKVDVQFHGENAIYAADQSLLKDILHKYI